MGSTANMKLFVVALFLFGILAPSATAESGHLCHICVDFFNEAIQELLDIILNGGVIGTCGELCSKITGWESAVCDIACDAVGIDAFVHLIDAADPDPISYCEDCKLCSWNPKANATITNVAVSPSSGAYGTQLKFTATPSEQEPFSPGQYQVQAAICAGTCGSKHEHAKVLGVKAANFTISG